AADLETGALIAGRGVDRAALPLDALDDLARVHLARALEDEVLEAMRPARGRLALPARAAAHRDGQGQGPETRHRVADHADAVGEGVQTGGQGFSFRRSRAT